LKKKRWKKKEEEELDSEELAKKIKADKKKKKEEEKKKKEEDQKEKKQGERLNALLNRLNGAEEKLKITQDKIVQNSSKRAAKATEFMEEASILEKEVEDQKKEEHVLDKSVKKAVENSLINIQNARQRAEKDAGNLKALLNDRNKSIGELHIRLKETESVSHLREQKIKELEGALHGKSKELERLQKILDGRARAEEIDIQDRRNHQTNKITTIGKQRNPHTINLNTGKALGDEFEDFWKTNEDAAVAKLPQYDNGKNTNYTLKELTKGKDLWISQMDTSITKKMDEKQRNISIDRNYIENQGIVISKINEAQDMKKGSQPAQGMARKLQDKGDIKLPPIANSNSPMVRQQSQQKYKSPSPGNARLLRA